MQASVDAIFCFLIFVEHREVGLLWRDLCAFPLIFLSQYAIIMEKTSHDKQEAMHDRA